MIHEAVPQGHDVVVPQLLARVPSSTNSSTPQSNSTPSSARSSCSSRRSGPSHACTIEPPARRRLPSATPTSYSNATAASPRSPASTSACSPCSRNGPKPGSSNPSSTTSSRPIATYSNSSRTNPQGLPGVNFESPARGQPWESVDKLSYSLVRDYVARQRLEIAAEAGRASEAGCVPQLHPPGAEAEVDFADLWIDLRGVRTKVQLFTLRLSCSGKAVHRAFATQAQEAFLEGHVQAFHELGGCPRTRSATTTSSPRCLGCCSGAPAPSPSGGSRSGPGPGSTRSTASPAPTAPTRRAASKVRVAGSAAPTWSRCPRWTPARAQRAVAPLRPGR